MVRKAIDLQSLARELICKYQPLRSGFEAESCHMGFVVDKVALGQVYWEDFGFPC
jgi:hypothetical protein